MAGRLIGRDDEASRLEAMARPGAVVTLTGPGGVGKTRLVLEVARRLGEREGVAESVALLGAVADGADERAVAGALGFESVAAAAVVLAQRPGAVVLDNCEHVLTAVRVVVEELRRAVPEVTFLATSREPLGVDDEQLVVVEPLALPAPGSPATGTAPSVQLFLERAAAAGAALDESPAVLADVADLCRRLDGLPLAIELAAARTRALTPGDLLAVVGEQLDVLARSPRRGDRHDTMRAAIEVSTRALPPAEHACFRRLGVFTGPFDLALAHAVAGEPGSDRVAAMDLLAALVDRSLVAVEVAGPTTRYRLLELLREHARLELQEQGELESVEERFVEAMTGVAERIVAEALDRWEGGMLSVASSQYPNLTRACELCLDRDATPHRAYLLLLPMFAAVHEGRPDEVWELGQRVLTRWTGHRAPWRAAALAVLASAAAIGGRSDDVAPLAAEVVDDPEASPIAAALADRAWGLATREHDHATAARHFHLAASAAAGMGARSLARELEVFEAGEIDLAGDGARALAMVTEARVAAEAAEDEFVAVFALIVEARVRLRAGDVDGASELVVAADTRSTAIGHPWWTAAILRTAAAVVSSGPGGWAAGAPHWRQALDRAAGRGAVGEIGLTLRAAAATALHVGERSLAEALSATAPSSRAITVLPELFPTEAAELARLGDGRRPVADLVGSLDEARTLLGGTPPDEPAPIPPVADAGRSGELARDGDGWRLTFAGRTTRSRDMKGIADLAVLVARPGTEVHALELVGGNDVGGAAGPVLDEQARRAYQERIVELQRDIDEARADHDGGRAERAELELDALVEQLSEAFGLGGRTRSTGSSAERARTAVTYRIRSAIRKVSEVHPELGRHLTHAVRTGTWCSYQPETAVRWTVTLTV